MNKTVIIVAIIAVVAILVIVFVTKSKAASDAKEDAPNQSAPAVAPATLGGVFGELVDSSMVSTANGAAHQTKAGTAICKAKCNFVRKSKRAACFAAC